MVELRQSAEFSGWLRRLKDDTPVWLEVTNLMIPTLNDGEEETLALVDWMLENLGDSVPLHFTAYHPDFKLRDKPRTPHDTLHRARRLAMQRGMKFVYEGNVLCEEGHTTFCPNCQRALIRRSWNNLKTFELTAEGNCNHCGTQIPGHFPWVGRPGKASYRFDLQ